VVVVLDLRGARPGTRLFHLLADHVRAPFGVEATNVSPSTVPLQFERNAVRRVEVKPALSGMPAEGYVVSTVRTEPSSVEVVGPESHLSRLTSATTDLVSVDDVRAGFHEEVTIGVVDTAVRLRRPQRATVIVDVARAESGRVVEGVPIDVRNLATPAFADLEVDRATATVEGGNEVVGRLRAADLRVWIDLANLGPGRHAVPVQFEGNTGYGVTRVEPAVVDVTIR
jgi:YbbR domain-containing protein